MEKEKLIELLNRYINEYDYLKEESSKYFASKELYEELLNRLTEDYQIIDDNRFNISFLMTTLYKDNIYLNELFNSIINIKDNKQNNERFKRLVKNINNDYQNILKNLEEANTRIYRNRYLYQSAKRVIMCLKYNMPITGKYDIINIKKILNYFETIGLISNKEELLLINEIELHNRKSLLNSKREKTEETYIESLYNEIPNIINAGYQKHDIIEVDDTRKPILDKFVKEITSYINELNKDEIISVIESYHNYNIMDNEYSYIITKILDYYQDSLITFYELLIDKDIYTNVESRIDVIKNYYSMLDNYLIIKKYYDELNTFVLEDEPVDEKEAKETKELIFSHSPNSSRTKIISDMKDIPHEYYNRVYDLITRFKSNSLKNSEIKKLVNNRKLETVKELRDDQIRVILKHIKGNLYCVMGVATKKDDNDIHMYNTMANRIIPNISTDELLKKELTFAKVAEDELAKLVKEKARKGNR